MSWIVGQSPSLQVAKVSPFRSSQPWSRQCSKCRLKACKFTPLKVLRVIGTIEWRPHGCSLWVGCWMRVPSQNQWVLGCLAGRPECFGVWGRGAWPRSHGRKQCHSEFTWGVISLHWVSAIHPFSSCIVSSRIRNTRKLVLARAASSFPHYKSHLST